MPAVSVALLPGHKLTGRLLITTVGCPIVKVAVLIVVQPLVAVTMQEYVVVMFGETVMEVVVAPVDQLYVYAAPPGPFGVTWMLTGEPPIQLFTFAGLMFASGDLNTTMV